MTAKAGIATLSDLDSELVEDLGHRIIDAIDLTQYLVAAGISEPAAPYYANKIRKGLILLIAKPEKENYAEAQRYLEEQRIRKT